MKRFLIVLFILIFSLVLAGDKVYNYDIRNMMEAGSAGSLDATDVSFVTIGGLSYQAWAIKTDAATANTFYSRPFETNGSQQYQVDGYVDDVGSEVGGDTVLSALSIGRYKGAGLAATDVEGWEYTSIKSFTEAALSVTYTNLVSTAINDTAAVGPIRLRYVETGAQENYVILWLRVKQAEL